MLYNKSQHYNIHLLASSRVGQILQPLVIVKGVCPHKEASNWFNTVHITDNTSFAGGMSHRHLLSVNE